MKTIICFLLFSAVSIMGLGAGVTGSGIPSVADYFDNLKGDMTKLTWAHAVNNRALLKKALGDGSVMMLEADVVLGTITGSSDVIPIMAHPPANQSDLSLEKFIEGVIDVQKTAKKGMKLDFKSTEAFVESLKIITAVEKKLNFPVWLNADILKGPVQSETKPVDADQFLGLSAEKLPKSTLSLGWTTRYGPNMTGNYTDQQLSDMQTAISRNKVVQPVTLAVRAGIVADTSLGITALVQSIDEFQKWNATTLTIWMSTDSDPVDIPKLRNLILTLGKSRTFLDVPETIRSQLNLNSGAGKTPVTGAVGAFVAVLTSVSAFFTHAFNLFD